MVIFIHCSSTADTHNLSILRQGWLVPPQCVSQDIVPDALWGKYKDAFHQRFMNT